MLRVTDVLERNVVLEVVEWDAAEGLTSLSKGSHLKSFLEVVKRLGITFTVWESRKVGKNVEFTSLMGPDKRTLLEILPQYFEEILLPETCGEIKWLWEDFMSTLAAGCLIWNI